MDEQLTTVQDFSVRIHFEKILETISTRIYDSQYAFLRENVQNAIDAIRIQATRDGMQTDAPKYRIDVRVKKNQCEIQDNGIGMTKEELSNNFWTMGASGKTTAEARAAGCIGFFGIGGFANFGVCDTLEVISRCRGCDTAHFTSLSRSAFREDNFQLPRVTYRTSDELTSHGTIIRGIGKTSFDPKSLETYLKQFVRYVKEPIFFQNELVSQESAATPRANYRELTEEITWKAGDVKVTFQLLADDGNNLAAKIFRVTLGAQRYECTGDVRLVHGQVDVYKRGFRLCAVTISSRIGVSGKLDTDFLQPTAGRDSLDSKSQTLLGQVFQIIETASYQAILDDPDLRGRRCLVPHVVLSDERHVGRADPHLGGHDLGGRAVAPLDDDVAEAQQALVVVDDVADSPEAAERDVARQSQVGTRELHADDVRKRGGIGPARARGQVDDQLLEVRTDVPIGNHGCGQRLEARDERVGHGVWSP